MQRNMLSQRPGQEGSAFCRSTSTVNCFSPLGDLMLLLCRFGLL